MRTLASELGSFAERLTGRPRIYADANVPAGLVDFMRHRLRWDVLFVLEADDLRRARDGEHYRLARQLRRTLVTLDRDYLDDARFPPAESGGVLVIAGPDERALAKILRRVARSLFVSLPTENDADVSWGLPLAGRKLMIHPDWRPAEPTAES